jgi:site-specific DNA recombinase
MTQTQPQSYQANTEIEPVQKAAIYARVSSPGQLGRDGDRDGDGYSIPAQVQACEREAQARGAMLAKVYVERAESARSDDRPVLQQMLKELPTLGVRYLIVHKVDRLARNRLDDATLYERLLGMNITLVSASENIDETPAGRLMHGMLATFAEYYSNNLATEIKKGLNQKHQNGGTPFKPPVGYRSRRELIGNQDIRTVEIDPERAPLVQLAFDLYVTGNWPLSKLTKHLAELGLTSRPTPKRAASPMRKGSVHKMLRNPYYVGIVEYCGRRVTGRHKPLIDRETFDRVQTILTARSIAGDRPSKHEHYLRGTLYCDECGGRLLYGKHRGNGGLYEYFSCTNRYTRGIGGRCRTAHYPVELVERAIEEHYRTIRLPVKVRESIWQDVRRDAEERTAVVQREAERHRRKIKKLQANQARLVQLSYRGLVTDEVLASEQQRLEDETQQAQRLLDAAVLHTKDIEVGLDGALAKTETPHATYLASNPLERRLLNQTFFTRIIVGEDRQIAGTTLTPVYAALSAWHEPLGQPPYRKAPTKPRKAAMARRRRQGSQAANRDRLSSGHGLPLTSMVDRAGTWLNRGRGSSEAWLPGG